MLAALPPRTWERNTPVSATDQPIVPGPASRQEAARGMQRRNATSAGVPARGCRTRAMKEIVFMSTLSRQALVAGLVFAATALVPAPGLRAEQPLRVYFIGNSVTD